MEEKELSGEEKRAAMKEQFKKDLRERQAFLEKMKNLSRQQKVVKAIQELNPEDDTDEWIRKVNEETALHEAKMELAMEASTEENLKTVSEEDLQKAVAEEMVRQIKKEMSGDLEGKEGNLEQKQGEETEKGEGPVRKMLD